MVKKYIVSIDTALKTSEKDEVQKSIEALNVNVVSRIDPLGVIAVEANHDEAIHQLRQIRGVIQVEDDATMSAL